MTQPDIADILLAAYNLGYCHGAGIPAEEVDDPRVRQLLARVAAQHQIARQIPDWLKALQTAPLGNGTSDPRRP